MKRRNFLSALLSIPIVPLSSVGLPAKRRRPAKPDLKRLLAEIKPKRMKKFESKVTNCIIHGRGGEILFLVTKKGDFLANLDGYAIVPNEEYLAMKSQARLAMLGFR